MLFFSDPDLYDGGDLMIRGEFARHRVKLPAGHLVLYSARTLHQVTAVTRGTRYEAFFWVQSLIREDSQRALLLELDETIQQLVTASSDDAAIVRLTGIYHNLLREWAIA